MKQPLRKSLSRKRTSSHGFKKSPRSPAQAQQSENVSVCSSAVRSSQEMGEASSRKRLICASVAGSVCAPVRTKAVRMFPGSVK